MHPGVDEWLRMRSAPPMPSLWAGRYVEMPLEWWLVLNYCLRSEKAAQAGDDHLERLMQMQADRLELIRVQKQMGFYD